MKILSSIVLAFCLVLMHISGAEASNRHIVQEQPLAAINTMTAPMSVNFAKNTPTQINIKKLADKSMLLICLEANNGIFVEQFKESDKYVAIKLDARHDGKEDLAIIGMDGAFFPNIYTLNEIKIIGQDEFGSLRSYVVDKFNPIEVLRVPMQVNARGELVFSQVGGTDLTIAWNGSGFVVNK